MFKKSIQEQLAKKVNSRNKLTRRFTKFSLRVHWKAITAIFLIMVISFSCGVFEAHVTGGITPHHAVPTYTIFYDGTNYYAKNSSGAIDYRSTSFNTVIQDTMAPYNVVYLEDGQTFTSTAAITVNVQNFTVYADSAIIYAFSSDGFDIGTSALAQGFTAQGLTIVGGYNGCNTAYNAFYLGVSGSYESEYATVSDCTIESFAYACYVSYSDYLNFHDNTVTGCGYGVELTSVSANDANIYHNQMQGIQTGDGIQTYGAGATIANNHIRDYTIGVEIDKSQNTITTNLLDADTIGIYLNGANATANSVESNICYYDTGRAIWLLNGASDNMIIGNEASEVTAAYPNLWLDNGCNNNTLVGGIGSYLGLSTAGDVSTFGIQLTGCSWNIITGFQLNNNVNYGLYIDSASTYNIVSNVIARGNPTMNIDNLGGSTNQIHMCYNGTTYIS